MKHNKKRLHELISECIDTYNKGYTTLTEFSSRISLITKIVYEGRFKVEGFVIGSICSSDPNVTPESLLQDEIDYLAKELFGEQ